MPPPPFLRLNSCALLLLLLCSSSISCFRNKWKNCRSIYRCGDFSFSYPFGRKNSKCGDREFRVTCGAISTRHPLLNIRGDEYHILAPYVLGNNSINGSIMIIKDNLWRDKCQLLDNYTQSWWYGCDIFKMARGYTNLTFWRDCNQSNFHEKNNSLKVFELSLCGNVWYYSFSPDIDFHGTNFCKTYLQLPVKEEVLKFNKSIDNQTFLEQGFEIIWHADPYRGQICGACLNSNGICGYNKSTTFLCYCPDGTSHPDRCPDEASTVDLHSYGKHTGVRHDSANLIRGANLSSIIVLKEGCSIGGIALTAIALGLLLKILRKRRKQPSPPPRNSISKVETFLREYACKMPTRYSHSDLKKITNNFVEKLGEGGFGVVYKGQLQNDALVAVKLLDRHRHSETQFMNEVATIGQIHHVNLVRLLGYCFESFTSALVYEYMPNGSLEKHIFSGKEKAGVLSWEQFHSIALGVARGIAYLHQDCERRIIHFDIKPHNILLDANFAPKVSDFGLAKLCEKGDDHISMSAGRGTPGYVAPEVCDTDLGPVTDKSDVYSFGMLLLEIVGGRRNFDQKVSRSSQFYFPDWAFKLLENGNLGMRLRLRGGGEMEAEDVDKVRKLTKVGLWCIQYDSRDRPCMSRVVQMLEGNGEDVSNAPLPFNFSASSATPENTLLSFTEASWSMSIVVDNGS